MALHPVKLPKSARYLFRVVALQKKLLKALAQPGVHASIINTAWVQNVWCIQDPEWVRKFCLGGQESVLHPLRTIATANQDARQALYDEFRKQNKVAKMLAAGGNFRKIESLPGFTAQLADAVTQLFKRCYKLLSHNTESAWHGYAFSGNCAITNSAYKEDFCSDYPTMVVCPYCDGEIGSPELDHYLAKSSFPLLACSPWNLVPVCRNCNDMVTAKGDRLAITIGSPCCTNDWLHPLFRPASANAQIKLNGNPRHAIPQLYSADPIEQTRLNNHAWLIRTLSSRWTNTVTAYHDGLVREVNRRVNADNALATIVRMRLEDHLESRGKIASAMVHAAVCNAVLENRPEYLAEFNNPNPPRLA